jgi:transcriptional regulator with XRE-family HTH domain
MAADDTVRRAIITKLETDGISQRQLGRMLGVSHNWVHRHLTGDAEFTVSDVERIADVLGVPMSSLLSEVA